MLELAYSSKIHEFSEKKFRELKDYPTPLEINLFSIIVYD